MLCDFGRDDKTVTHFREVSARLRAMYSDVILIHRPGGQGRSTLIEDLRRYLKPDDHIFTWQTCLRQIALLDSSLLETVRPALLRGDEIYHDDVAYRFLLEVICGLHSPIIGETEVYGQVKNAVAAQEPPLTPWGSRLRRLFRALFEDAKQIRQEHLEDIGSQSYGSILRRDLKGLRSLHVIGAGQLVQEILPWLNEHHFIHVYARDKSRARAAIPAPLQETVNIHLLEEREHAVEAEAVIIAAPVTAAFISDWLRTLKSLKCIVDLRADSATDRVSAPREGIQLIDLNDVFNRLEANQASLEKRKAAALRAVAEATVARGGYIENRPFGWEDLCA